MSTCAVDFAAVCELVRERTGISLGADKRYLLESRLGALARELGFDSTQALVADLGGARSGPLVERVVEAMLTNETSFFRDHRPFEVLEKRIVPELIARRNGTRRLSIWSAACSSGQEPYSVALLLEDAFPQLATWDVRILGTDLAERMLERARRGVYSQLEVNRGLPARLLVEYFHQDDTRWTLDERVRRRVEFRRLNLSEPLPPLPRFDLVLVRNVLIYLDPAVRDRILGGVADRLARDGYLLLGATETLIGCGVADRFEQVRFEGGVTAYRPRC